jgi:parallel beta-helix repeat protein
LPGPCFTIATALSFARDGDTIIVESGIYEICSTLEVSKLVTITAGSNVTAGNAKAILHSFTGQSVFHVTTIGASVGPTGQSTHVVINGLAIGGAFQPGQAAILLDGDGYTDITNNVLGGEQLNNPSFNGEPCPPAQQPLPPGFGFTPPASVTKQEVFGNAASIMLQNSDHPNISNNSILGSSIFKFAPVLNGGDTATGFGIVTSECLGLASDSSDGLTIASNLIDRNINAGIWLCSDGGGFHQIKSNTVRNNGSGIVLRAIADSTLDSNTVSNDLQDGIVVYEAANNNTLSNNIVESHRTSGAAGIRIGGFGGSLFPLQTVLTSNRLLRNWTGIVIAGARNTAGTSNIITAEDVRTAVLLQVGATGSPNVTQPAGTVFHQNQIIANGSCGAGQGCAVRMDSFVTVAADFTQNNFGLPGDADLNSVLWHKPNDPALGYVSAGQATGAVGGNAGSGSSSGTGTPGPGTTGSGPSSTPTPGTTGSSPSSTATPGTGNRIVPCTAPNVPPGCTPTPSTSGNPG